MVTKQELIEWLGALSDDNVNVAADDGGLTLVGVDCHGNPTGDYLEVGGVPTSDETDEEKEDLCSYCGSGRFSERGVCLKCGL